MGRRVLITGGAGFIGSHLADELLRHGYEVRALDLLLPQIHGPEARRPAYLAPEVELIKGDVRNKELVCQALKGVDAVFHLAAMVGVGQSMYEIEKYTSTNNYGTAVLLEALASCGGVERLVVASSMSIYGEGLCRDAAGNLHNPPQRTLEQLQGGAWELRGAKDEVLTPVPTPELKVPSLASIYALSKYDQERMCLIFGSAYRVPVLALRLFNVYGPRQALANPYTGVLAIFAARLLNGKPPTLFEDGRQQRDFVSVYDVAAAGRLALEARQTKDQVFNIGSGRRFTVYEIALSLARVLNRPDIEPEVTGTYRAGDIRHCFADISEASQQLGYQPRIAFEQGVLELAEWLAGQSAPDNLTQAHAELRARGLTI
ncbi:nucleoside-diphosphate-sugar epimerase [Geomonas silvestris]|uniref:Nucleoside-diphosphate-sugar epimerase n=1 Tax=Geomonas silvestris TaxID=2740184 RepID=A0A6V8MCK9_9BACT|nr:NAD-dependent epimerase/dehydratase family protein [Geomonas silvestris]GFO57740.1 nucleoside-diphosphate-sugar epimerase [Geomonas silvestris]